MDCEECKAYEWDLSNRMEMMPYEGYDIKLTLRSADGSVTEKYHVYSYLFDGYTLWLNFRHTVNMCHIWRTCDDDSSIRIDSSRIISVEVRPRLKGVSVKDVDFYCDTDGQISLRLS